jgi:SAM-dependent methyltransferase
LRHRSRARQLGLTKGNRFCPICGSFTEQWEVFGKAHKTKCAVCGSLGRHRHLFWRMAVADLLRGDGRKILHVAPEGLLRTILSQGNEANYYDLDLRPGKARLCMDITAIEFDDGFFDLVICNHVLEHVPNDAKAVSELARVLSPTGAAFITVPILYPGETVQDDNADTPERRLKAHRHFDHRRAYGLAGFRRLLSGNGFDVEELPAAQYARHPLLSLALFEDTIFMCCKASAPR